MDVLFRMNVIQQSVLLQFIFENSISILREPYSSNWC